MHSSGTDKLLVGSLQVLDLDSVCFDKIIGMGVSLLAFLARIKYFSVDQICQ